jgi:hypothetical protein
MDGEKGFGCANLLRSQVFWECGIESAIGWFSGLIQKFQDFFTIY